MGKRESRKQVDTDVRAFFQELSRQQSIDHWLGIIKPKAVELLRPYSATLFVGRNAERKQQITEERCSAVWPHQLPEKRPANVKAGTWRQAQYARDVLHEIHCLEHQFSKGEPRGVAIHAMRVGAIVEAINVAPFIKDTELGAKINASTPWARELKAKKFGDRLKWILTNADRLTAEKPDIKRSKLSD